MASRSKKQGLLNQQGYDQADMIQLVEISKFHQLTSPNTQQTNYITLNDEPTNPQPKSQPQPQTNPPQPRQQRQPQLQPHRQQQPYPHPQPQPQVRKSTKIPQMKVACNYCTFEQSVPGNTQVYVCCCCNNMNQCFPLYGLFICGTCQGKVCYPYGTSQLIRCTRCKTINRVPAEPKKSYIKQLANKPNLIKQQVSPTQKFTEQIHHQETSKMPERPIAKEVEQQIFFEPVALKKEEKTGYPDLL